ncbi:hypothetical protein JTE90_005045 [Oedothorax gibbosus]|uniref:Uncharacterized protein n=1 Tax=Oedothorax gibbosus TaxID=931172 RepID=A0AAV6VB98_9ARAC|nr:hypothetical protein JTE90_005045 [Oedothorax gibbosus]
MELPRLFLACFFSHALVTGCDLNLFKSKGIVPNYLPTTPKKECKVTYDDHSIDCGCTESRGNVLQKPTVSFPADKEKYYSVIMIGPDAPLVSPFLHWLVQNVPGDRVDQGDTCSVYIPPLPCLFFLDPHRYVISVYEQPHKFEEGSSDIMNKLKLNLVRNNFDLKEFAKSCSLIGPICGNFFYV